MCQSHRPIKNTFLSLKAIESTLHIIVLLTFHLQNRQQLANVTVQPGQQQPGRKCHLSRDQSRHKRVALLLHIARRLATTQRAQRHSRRQQRAHFGAVPRPAAAAVPGAASRHVTVQLQERVHDAIPGAQRPGHSAG